MEGLRTRAALVRGWHELWRAPAATFLALAGALAAALATGAAWLRAGQALDADRPGRALLTLFAGAAAGALLADATRATALTAYAGAPRPFAQTVALGLLRTPAMITVRAVELLVYFTIALGELFVLVRALLPLGRDATAQALVAALCLLPALSLALIVFAASRVAQTLVARGLPAAAALADGYDVVLRRFPSLARLGLLALLATAPFWIVAQLVPTPLDGLVLGFAALWLYAALAVLVGRDARLAFA